MLTRARRSLAQRVAALAFGGAILLTGLPAVADDAVVSDVRWRAQGTVLQRIDGRGGVVQHVFPEPARAVAIAGDARAFVATGHALWSVAAGDAAPQRIWQSTDDEPTIVTLHVDAARGLLWVARTSDILQLDLLDAMRERLRVEVGDHGPTDLDIEQGVLWLLGESELTALDARGGVVTVVDIPREIAASANSLHIDAASVARIETAAGSVAVDLATNRVERLDVSPFAVPAAAFSPALTVAPALTNRVESAPEDRTLSIRLRASCAPHACDDDARYAELALVSATIDDVDASARLVSAGHGVWHLSLAAHEASAQVRIRITAVDAYGNRTAADVRGNVASRDHRKTNALPTVRITAPVTGAIAVAPASFTIAATAADTDGTITKVEFYRNGVLLGTDATAPYTWAWTNVAVGTYSLTAKAYDNAGGTTVSTAVSVQVKANVPPVVTLVSPPAGASFVAPATITLSANATDADGTVAKVDFLRGGTTAIGSVAAKPFTFTWSNVPAGTYSLTAKATDDKGATTTSAAVTAKVNNPPSVSITAPLNGAHVVAPASITIKANAADTDGTIAKVEFLGDGTLLGTDTSSPYSVVWNGAAIGSHTLTARATDNLGAVTTSTPVSINVDVNQAPSVALTAPSANARRYAGSSLTLTATAADPDGTIARVEFLFGTTVVATDVTAPYTATVVVPSGVTSITAAAVDNMGVRSMSAPVLLTGVVNQPPTVTLDAPLDYTGFVVPSLADIPMSASASDPDGTITRVRLMAAPYYAVDDSEGPPITVATLASPPYAATWRGVAVPVDPVYAYRVWAEADDDAGATVQSAHATVTVSNTSPWFPTIVEPSASVPIELDAPATIVVAGRVDYAYSNPGADPLQRVELLADGVAVATLLAPNGASGEHVFVWRNVGVGAHQLQLRAFDALGLSSVSDPVQANVVAPNRPPVVALQLPVANQVFVTNAGVATVPINVSASDPDGVVTKMSAVNEGTFFAIGVPPSASLSWTGMAAGVHVVTGRAKDDRAGESETPPVFIEVVAAQPPPVVAITAPLPGGAYTPGQPITVSAEADGVDPIQRVDFITLENSNLIGSVSTPPYRIVWKPPPMPLTLRAVAYSANGRNAGSVDVPLNILTNTPPTVSLTAPGSGSEFMVGQSIPMVAVASDVNGTINSVGFAVNGTTIGTDTSAPYGATWTPTAPGTYALTATATDNQGASGISGAVERYRRRRDPDRQHHVAFQRRDVPLRQPRPADHADRPAWASDSNRRLPCRWGQGRHRRWRREYRNHHLQLDAPRGRQSLRRCAGSGHRRHDRRLSPRHVHGGRLHDGAGRPCCRTGLRRPERDPHPGGADGGRGDDQSRRDPCRWRSHRNDDCTALRDGMARRKRRVAHRRRTRDRRHGTHRRRPARRYASRPPPTSPSTTARPAPSTTTSRSSPARSSHLATRRSSSQDAGRRSTAPGVSAWRASPSRRVATPCR